MFTCDFISKCFTDQILVTEFELVFNGKFEFEFHNFRI